MLPLYLVQSKSSPLRFFQEQKPPSKVQLLMIGGGMVGGGVGGTAREGTTEHRVEENVMSSTAMSPLTLLPRTASNTTYKGKVTSEGSLEEGVKACKYNRILPPRR